MHSGYDRRVVSRDILPLFNRFALPLFTPFSFLFSSPPLFASDPEAKGSEQNLTMATILFPRQSYREKERYLFFFCIH